MPRSTSPSTIRIGTLLIAFAAAGCSKSLDRGRAGSLVSEYEGFKKTIQDAFVEGKVFCSSAFMNATGVLLGEGLAQFRPDPQSASGLECIVSLTESGKSAARKWSASSTGWLVPLADREIVEVTGITSDADQTTARTEFTWRWAPRIGHVAVEPGPRTGFATMKLYDDGWRVLDVGLNPKKSEPVEGVSPGISQADALVVLRRDIHDVPTRERVHLGAECVKTNVWFDKERAEAAAKREYLRQLAASGMFSVEDLGKTPPCYVLSGSFSLPPDGLPVTFAIDLSEKGRAESAKWPRDGNSIWVPLHEGSQVEKVTEVTSLNADGSYVNATFERRLQRISGLARARGFGETTTSQWRLVKFGGKWGAAKFTIFD